jgi:hypothetical protein
VKRQLPPGPIPPLSDAAVSRIERGVFAALDAPAPLSAPARHGHGRRRVVAYSLASAAVAAAVFAGLGVREGRRGGGAPTQVMTTTAGSRIALAGAELEIAPESAVRFGAGKDGATVVELDRGAVTCEVAPRTNRAPFIVQAGETRVTVIGTRFTVRRLGAHATVTVEHGLVEVADTNMTQLVHPGERFRPGELVAPEPVAAVPVATPAVNPVPASAPTPVQPTLVAPVVTAPARRAHERRVALATPVAAPAAPAPAEAPEAPAEAPVAAAEAPRESGPRGSPQVLFELAAQLEVREPSTALGIYTQIAAGDDAWAASALFASARLEAERGHAGEARGLSETYLRRFPRGANADDARSLLEAR